jgi:hypothetical protein
VSFPTPLGPTTATKAPASGDAAEYTNAVTINLTNDRAAVGLHDPNEICGLTNRDFAAILNARSSGRIIADCADRPWQPITLNAMSQTKRPNEQACRHVI